MIDAELSIRGAGGWHRVALGAYLNPEADEQAHGDAHDWIKRLRNLPVSGAPFRARFTARGDSLWWFTEIYLHKQQVILDIHRTLAAVDALIERERPREIRIDNAPVVVRHVAGRVAAARGVPCAKSVSGVIWWHRMARLDLRARALTASAYVTADRLRRPPVIARRPDVAAFIHRAFWRGRTGEASAESYIGPVLGELEHRLGVGGVQYVGVGPAANFRSRRRIGLLRPGPAGLIPVERLAPARLLSQSREIWKRRFEYFRLLTDSEALRQSATIRGIDCWPLVREELAGIAWLQWPWSVRAMDEAAAALDALRPSAVLTYAEAGGWGRALVLEARRRGIPSAGLQHGFIYRHWLNYRHEADEMEAQLTPPFPYPTRTLVFDQYAATHLAERGRFPAEAVQVTGSSRLDELADTLRKVRDPDIAETRNELRLRPSDALVLIATKEKEARRDIGPFLAAARAVTDAVLVIKPHPAETAEQYADVARQHPDVRIAAPETPLSKLLAVARVVVTVNSTVALDAGAFDIPALIIGLPNNLSPFVLSGAFVGSADPAEAAVLLDRLLHDSGLREQLKERRRAVLGDPAGGRNGRAAVNAAEAVTALVAGAPSRRAASE
jgi:hypothetical protein